MPSGVVGVHYSACQTEVTTSILSINLQSGQSFMGTARFYTTRQQLAWVENWLWKVPESSGGFPTQIFASQVAGIQDMLNKHLITTLSMKIN